MLRGYIPTLFLLKSNAKITVFASTLTPLLHPFHAPPTSSHTPARLPSSPWVQPISRTRRSRIHVHNQHPHSPKQNIGERDKKQNKSNNITHHKKKRSRRKRKEKEANSELHSARHSRHPVRLLLSPYEEINSLHPSTPIQL
jgi:hypothetical protein